MFFITLIKLISMKRLLLLLIIMPVCLIVSGQEPGSFNYQVVVRNASGELVKSHTVSFRISILSGNAYNTVVYSEIHNVRTSQKGLVSLEIGNGTKKTGNFESIDWRAENYFLKVEIDPSGGNDYKEMSMTQILNIPYSPSLGSSKKSAATVTEDKLVISRKYVGNFIDFRQTGPSTGSGPNIVWIKTSLDKMYGKISAYGKKCDFSVGDKLYIKRTYYTPGGLFGFWVYQIENDSSVYYKVTDFQYDHKVPVETWFK